MTTNSRHMGSLSTRVMTLAWLCVAAVAPTQAFGAESCLVSSFSPHAELWHVSVPYRGTVVEAHLLGDWGDPLDTAQEEYYGSRALLLMRAHDLAVVGYEITGTGGQAPGLEAMVQGKTIEANTGGLPVPLIWHVESMPLILDPGDYYIAAFGLGGGSYSAIVTILGATDCEPVSADLESVQLDQSDFDSSGETLSAHFRAPGLGLGIGLSHVLMLEDMFFGYMMVDAVGGSSLHYSARDESHAISGGEIIPIAFRGPAEVSLRLEYAGLLPSVHIDGYLLNLY